MITMQQVTKIEFTARETKGKASQSAPTAHEALASLLAISKARLFTVTEYRDGKHLMQIGAGDDDISYFYRKFTRAEALAFIGA